MFERCGMGCPLRQRFLFLCLAGIFVVQVGLLMVMVCTPSAVPLEGRSCDCQPCHSTTNVQRPDPRQSAVQHKQASNSTRLLSKRVSTFLLIVVLSSVNGRELRNVIRTTWARGLPSSTVVLFSIGTQGLEESHLSELLEEERLYSDMLFLSDLHESYRNLTRKVLYSFMWADENAAFSYLMKCDDDSFVLAENISAELNKRQSTDSYYWGFFNGRANLKKKGKWHEEDWFLCDYYLPYALGGGYILSADLVHSITMNAAKLQLYNSEDVSVGVWLSGYQVERRHDTRFNTEFVSRGCNNVYLVSHKQSVSDMLTKHQLLQTVGRQCKKEFQSRLSYEYRWDVPPSQCCDRQQGLP